MKTEVRFDTLNFVNSELVVAPMYLDVRAFDEKLVLRSIYLPILALIKAHLTAPHSIE
jgi:hypothetical protein